MSIIARGWSCGRSRPKTDLAMPQTEGLKGLISHMMTEQVDMEMDPLCMAVLDVPRADYNADAEREHFVNLPEAIHETSYATKLMKAYPGSQDAARLWSACWTSHLEKHGFRIGQSNRSLFASDLVRGCCHGDDFIVVGSRTRLEQFGKTMNKGVECCMIGMVGFDPDLDKEVKVLHRIVRGNG